LLIAALTASGTSFLDALVGQPHERGPVYWEHEGHRAVRDGRWKPVSLYASSWELYDMQQDRVESNNLANRHPDIVARMSALHDAWATSVGVVPWDVVRGGYAE